MLAAGYSLRTTVQALSRPPNTRSRELARHGTAPLTYRAVAAHKRAQRWSPWIAGFSARSYAGHPVCCGLAGKDVRVCTRKQRVVRSIHRTTRIGNYNAAL
jgi:hypothetical protein